MKHAAVIVLEALLVGLPVSLGKHKYAMDQEGVTGPIFPDYPEKGGDQFILEPYLTVGQLVRLSKEISQDDLFILSSNVALNKGIK